jgi:hypothetical protein
MATIQWRINYDYTQPQVRDDHLGLDPLLLQATILRIQHMVKKLAKQTQIGTLTNY